MSASRLLLVAVAAATWTQLDACSCMPQHPQASYCQADFAIVGRVQRLFKAKDQFSQDVYKIKIRNILKATPKAQLALKAGRLLSPSESSLCQVSLQPRETYVITGRITQLEAHINLCNFVSRWRDVTPRQRKGFRALYKQGCSCKVHIAMNTYQMHRPQSPNACRARYDDCFVRHGVCLHRNNGRCMWVRAPKLTRCLQIQRFNGTTT